MANEATMDKLYQMRMSVMARAYREQEESIGVAEMPFDDRLAMLVDAEWDARRANKRTRLLRQAAFCDPDANVCDVRYDPDRALDRAKVMELSNCTWVDAARNLIITGASGAGEVVDGMRFGSGCLQCVQDSEVRAAAGTAGYAVHRKRRDVGEDEKAVHRLRFADRRRLAAGDDISISDQGSSGDSGGKAQEGIAHSMLAVRALRMAREARRQRHGRRRRGQAGVQLARDAHRGHRIHEEEDVRHNLARRPRKSSD